MGARDPLAASAHPVATVRGNPVAPAAAADEVSLGVARPGAVVARSGADVVAAAGPAQQVAARATPDLIRTAAATNAVAAAERANLAAPLLGQMTSPRDIPGISSGPSVPRIRLSHAPPGSGSGSGPGPPPGRSW